MVRYGVIKKRIYPRLLWTIRKFLEEFAPDPEPQPAPADSNGQDETPANATSDAPNASVNQDPAAADDDDQEDPTVNPPNEASEDNNETPEAANADDADDEDDDNLARFFDTRPGQIYELYCLSLTKGTRFNPNFVNPPGLELPIKARRFRGFYWHHADTKRAPWSWDCYPVRVVEPYCPPPPNQKAKPKTPQWVEAQKQQAVDDAVKLKRDWEKVKQNIKGIVKEAKWTFQDLDKEEQEMWEKDVDDQMWWMTKKKQEEKEAAAGVKENETRSERMMRMHRRLKELEMSPDGLLGRFSIF